MTRFPLFAVGVSLFTPEDASLVDRRTAAHPRTIKEIVAARAVKRKLI
jgi:hypothetical protein